MRKLSKNQLYRIRNYMNTEAKEHVDLDTAELNCTTLAEDAAKHFDLYGPAPNYDIPEVVFELAFELSVREEEA